MTANLVVQVCMEPKLVGVALEHDSVTSRLVSAGGGFSVSLLARADRDVVRRFVKPVKDVAAPLTGPSSPCRASPSPRSDRTAAPCWRPPRALSIAASPPRCPSGATPCASARSRRSPASLRRCSAWRTPACTTAAERRRRPRRGPSRTAAARSGRSASGAASPEAADRCAASRSRRPAPHRHRRSWRSPRSPAGPARGSAGARALDRWHAARADRLGPSPEPGHHLLRVEPGHGGQRRG